MSFQSLFQWPRPMDISALPSGYSCLSIRGFISVANSQSYITHRAGIRPEPSGAPSLLKTGCLLRPWAMGNLSAPSLYACENSIAGSHH